MINQKHRDMCKLSPEEQLKKIREALTDVKENVSRHKAKDVLQNLYLISDKDLLKEVARRKLNVGYPIGCLESVSTTKLKEELRRRKK